MPNPNDPTPSQRIEVLMRSDVSEPGAAWHRATAGGKLRKWECVIDADDPEYPAVCMNENEIADWRPLTMDKKLIERLALAAGGNIEHDPRGGSPPSMAMYGNAIDRFASLIAEECAATIELRAGMRGTGAWTALTAAASALREKFKA